MSEEAAKGVGGWAEFREMVEQKVTIQLGTVHEVLGTSTHDAKSDEEEVEGSNNRIGTPSFHTTSLIFAYTAE